MGTPKVSRVISRCLVRIWPYVCVLVAMTLMLVHSMEGVAWATPGRKAAINLAHASQPRATPRPLSPHLAVDPPSPCANDEVTIYVSGEWGNSCPVPSHYCVVDGNTIEIMATITQPPGRLCAPVITPWCFTETLGILTPGDYLVTADVLGGFWGFSDQAMFGVLPGPARTFLPIVVKAGG